MKKINYFLTVISICLSLLTFAEAAHKPQLDKKKGDVCSDPQQPASLHCAPAPSSQYDSQGRLWIVWSYAGHIYVTSSDDDGTTLNASVVVNRTPEGISAHGENRPKIVVDNKGKIYVSWTTPLKKRYTGNVRFSYSEDEGLNFSTPITVNDNLDLTGHRFESLAVNEQGTIFMAWLDKRERFKAKQKGEKYIGAALYYSYSIDGGKSFKSNQNIMSHSCECCRVVMDIDTDQLPVILWRNIYGTNTRDHSLVKFLTKEKSGEVTRVSHDNWKIDACPHHGPALSISRPEMTQQSNYHLVWFNNAPERHGLFYSRINNPNSSSENTKSPTSDPISIGHYANGASHPDILSLDNKVWIVWKEFDGKNESVWLQFSDDSGQNWKQSQILVQTKNGSDYPFLVNNKGNVYLQWKTRDDGFKLYPIK